MPVIERESEEIWNQWVSSLERFMDGAEGFLYGAYRVVRWPFAGLWGLGRGLLQLANILGEPEASPAPLTHHVVDFRGAWYTGTSLMNRFGPTRRLYQWFRSWYCMGEERLKRWYGEDYRFEEVTFQGRLHGNTAFYLFDRLEKLKAHRLPGYHIPVSERPELPAREALCRVHFKGDYDLASAQGLGLVLYDVWRMRYPLTVTPNESESEPDQRHWYAAPLSKRVGLLKLFNYISMFGQLSTVHDWNCQRFKMNQKVGALHKNDAASLPNILTVVDNYLDSTEKIYSKMSQDFNKTASLHQIGVGVGGSLQGSYILQPHSTSFKYLIEYDSSLDWDIRAKENIRNTLRIASADLELVDTANRLSPECQALQEEFSRVQAQLESTQTFWDDLTRTEIQRGEYAQREVGIWRFWQDVFGFVRLKSGVAELQREEVSAEEVAEKRTAWGEIVLGVERVLDFFEVHLHALASGVVWPAALVWRGLRGLLQWANILETPKPPSFRKQLTVDFRGAWYTGTALLNRLGWFRRFHHWLVSWYCLSEHRLTRWYGRDYTIENVTFLGVLDRAMVDSLLARLIELRPHRLPGYYISSNELSVLPETTKLCQVNFEGDYSIGAAHRLVPRLEGSRFAKCFPVDVQLTEHGKMPCESHWYIGSKEERVELLEQLRNYQMHGLLRNELLWMRKRLRCPRFGDRVLNDTDALVIEKNQEEFDTYLQEFQGMILRYELNGPSMDLGSAVDSDNSESMCMSYQLRRWRSVRMPETTGVIDTDLEGHDLLAMIRSAVSARRAMEGYWSERIKAEMQSEEYERAGTDLSSCLQRAFGVVRLQAKTPEGVSPDAIQQHVSESGVSGLEGMVPISGPDNGKSTDVFSEPHQPMHESTASEVGRDTGAFPVTLPV